MSDFLNNKVNQRLSFQQHSFKTQKGGDILHGQTHSDCDTIAQQKPIEQPNAQGIGF